MGRLRIDMKSRLSFIRVSNLHKSEVQVTAAPDINCFLFRAT